MFERIYRIDIYGAFSQKITILILCYLARLRKLQSPIQYWETGNYTIDD